MIKKQALIRRLADGLDLPGEPVPGLSILELIGDNRLLVENHRGIRHYCKEKIIVCVSYGTLEICGENLEVLQMTTAQLIITGQISAVVSTQEVQP